MIAFDLPNAGDVRVSVYDILGRKIAELIPPSLREQGDLKPGTYEVEWDGSGFASGIYFYKLVSEGYSETKKMVLVK